MARPAGRPHAAPLCDAVPLAWPGPFSRLPLVRHLPPAARERFFAAFEERTVEAGTTLSRQHERDTHFHVVLRGSCELRRDDATGAPVWRRTVATGGYLGHWALLSGARAERTARMTSAGCVMSLPLEQLQSLLVEPRLVGLTRLTLPALRRRAGRGHVHLQLGRREAQDAASDRQRPVRLADLRHVCRTLDRGLRYSVGGASWRDNCAAAFLLLQAGVTVWGLEEAPTVAVLEPARLARAGGEGSVGESARITALPVREDMTLARWERVLGPALERLRRAAPAGGEPLPTPRRPD